MFQEDQKPNFKSFQKRYFDFIAAIEGNRIASIAVTDILRDYPKNLPHDTRNRLARFLRELGEALQEAASALSSTTVTPFQKSIPADDLQRATHTFFMAAYFSNSDPMKFDFAYRTRAQELAMALAYFEGFLVDILRMICDLQPSILKSRKKTMTWEDALSCGSWNKLMQNLIEGYTLEFSIKPARKQFEHLREHIGLVFEADIETIEQSEQIRHLIIHNNCTVSAEYNRRMGASLPLGSQIEISQNLVFSTIMAVQSAAGTIIKATATKFLAATPFDLKNIMTFKKP